MTASLTIAAAVPAIAVAGAVAGLYIGASLNPIAVIAGTSVSLCSGAISRAALSRAPWTLPIARRLRTFEAPAPATEVPILVRADEDLTALEAALRRAHFHPSSTLLVGIAPEDASDLRLLIRVQEPNRWSRSSSDAHRVRRLTRLLQEMGSRARVAGVDVDADADLSDR